MKTNMWSRRVNPADQHIRVGAGENHTRIDAVQEFRIELSKVTFFAGESVDGCVVISVNDEYIFDSLTAQLYGSATVEFYLNKMSYAQEQEYINKYQQLRRTGDDALNSWNTVERLRRGRHVFPFSFHLPSTLPGSLVELSASRSPPNCCGTIRYVLIVSMNRTGFKSRTITTEVSVVNPVDLITADLERPFTRALCEDIYSCFRYLGQIQVEATLNKCGYRPGEMILVTLHFRNTCRSQPRNTSIELLLRRTLALQAQGETIRKLLDYPYYRTITSHSFEIPIPEEVSDSLLHCDLMSIDYKVIIKVIIKVGLLANIMKLEMPVIIAKLPNYYPEMHRHVFENNFEVTALPSCAQYPSQYQSPSYQNEANFYTNPLYFDESAQRSYQQEEPTSLYRSPNANAVQPDETYPSYQQQSYRHNYSPIRRARSPYQDLPSLYADYR